jgi:hypothetical protein
MASFDATFEGDTSVVYPDTDNDTDQSVWRPDAWLRAANFPFSKPKLYAEIRRGALDAQERPGDDHLDEPERVLRELAATDRPGGRAWLQAHRSGVIIKRPREGFHAAQYHAQRDRD